VSLLQRRCQCDDLPTHIALPISEPAYLVFLCQLVSLLQGQITIDLVDWASHSKWVCYNGNSLDSATNRLLFVSSTTYLYSQNWRTTARWYVLGTEWNIYYMPETTKIWAEIRSSLNIWSWIKRACLNDKNSEPATKAWTKQALLHACSRDESTVSLLQGQTTIDLLIESINERNKLYYVVGLNQKWACFNGTVRIDLFDEQVD